jgi:hypothetical protein
MSGEGLLAVVPGYEAWGFSTGVYPVNCIDCENQSEEDKILGSVSSYRCLTHAIRARCSEQDEGVNVCLPFYEPSPISFDALSKGQQFQLMMGMISRVMITGLGLLGVAFYLVG